MYGKMKASDLAWTERCSLDASSCAGRVLELGLSQVVRVQPGGFTVLSGRRSFDIRSEAQDIARGDTVSVRAKYVQGSLVETARKVHPYRGLKAYHGVLGLLLLVPFIARYWTDVRGDHA
jgi:hypothetical protein